MMFRYCCVRLFAFFFCVVSCSSGMRQAEPNAAMPQSTLSAKQANRATEWLQQTTAHLSSPDAELIRRDQATLLGNLVSEPGWKPYLGLEPSRNDSVGGKVISNPYPGVWNWDAAFHAIALSHWDGGLAREQFAILFSHQ